MTNLKINIFSKIIKLVIVTAYFFPTSALSDEISIIELIEKEWNQTQTLIGKFHQRVDGNEFVSGDFFIEKPFKSKFIYHNEVQNIVTSKYFINFVDKKGYLNDRYPIINQPIYKLFSKKLNLNDIFEIQLIDQNEDEVIIRLIDKNNDNRNNSKITLTFHSSNYLLKKWEIVDALEQSTYLEFTNIRKNISIDQNLFIFKEKIE